MHKGRDIFAGVLGIWHSHLPQAKQIVDHLMSLSKIPYEEFEETMKAAKRLVGRLARYAQILASSYRNEDPENLRKLVLGESKDDMVMFKDCQAAETLCNTKQG